MPRDNMLYLVAPWIIAVTLAIVLAIVKYLYSQSSSVGTAIPGPERSVTTAGNLAVIARAGSLHQFLMDLHHKFGDIASFWFGETFVVSIASPELFKQHSRLFDRPPELFKLFEPLITAECIQYANGADGRERRSLYDPCFSHEAVDNFHDTFKEVTEDFAKKLQGMPPDEHIPLVENMNALALKAIGLTSFGSFFKDENEVLKFKENYAIAWEEMEGRLSGDNPGLDSQHQFEEAKKYLYDTIQRVIEKRRDDPSADHNKVFIDTLLASGRPESEMRCDALAYIIGGFHTSSLLLTWGLYYLASHPEVQDKVSQELVALLGEEDIPARAIPQLTYMRQVLDETLRCSVLAPFAARVQYEDSELGGYKVPAGTPVLHALGVRLQDERQWPEPTKFDPDRFSPDNRKKMPNCSFEPFGFAGKRKCPGYRFAYSEATAVFAGLLRKFEFKIVPGQTVTKVYGLVTKPKDELWVTVKKR